jgi:CBS domain containing-hemolysin-like protein
MTSDILITLFLVFMNGFFVAAEFAIVKVRESQLEVEAQSGNLAAILAKKIVGNISPVWDWAGWVNQSFRK